MAIFKRGPGPFALHLSMTGIQMGERLLQIGCGDGRLFAALASKVGLTGRACAVDRDEEAVERAKRAAAKEGVLVEVEPVSFRSLPYENESFDLVVVRDVLSGLEPYERVRCLQETLRVLRPAGRCIVVEPAERGGIAGLVMRSAKNKTYVAQGGAERALKEEGYKAVRILAERDGVLFTEGLKKRE
jgi:ubiquinone/menaquinone biosynthesis C-methylase UbiE